MKLRSVGWVLALSIALLSVGATACNFYFNYDSIAASIGTVGDIGIRVEKTHKNCTLTSMDEYAIEGEGIQILGETAWENVGSNLYEKWIQVSLSETGDGFVRISKDCTKEGYQEAVLPITGLLGDGDEDIWTLAWSGSYPFETPEAVNSVVGQPIFDGSTLTIGDVTVGVPESVGIPESLPAWVRLYTTVIDGATAPVLLLGDGIFLRFDHLL